MPPFRLILCEKPSVARDLARVLGSFRRGEGRLERELPDGSGEVISWCLGHLVRLAEPDELDERWKRWVADELPIVPEPFTLLPRTDDGGARRQWETVRDLLAARELTAVVNACDAGREGELIFRFAYELAGCRAPVSRLWISAMTDRAIRDGMANLRPGQAMEGLAGAARSRAEADWLVGMNATRALTLANRAAGGDALLTVGRVQTPTLALLVAREQAIRDFKPEPFWQLRLRLQSDAEHPADSPKLASWQALWKRGKTDRLDNEDEARALLEHVLAQDAEARAAGEPARITKAERKRRRERPPLLYDLTTLQRAANARFGWSAKHTLAVAQALYEQHKLLTYPRTDSRHLTCDQERELPPVLSALEFGPYQQAAADTLAHWPTQVGKRVFDDGEVTDHHAIIPTVEDPRSKRLSADEKRLYDLVARRLLGAFAGDAVFAMTDLEATVGGEVFHARGRVRLEPGWQTIDPPRSKGKETELPPVETGEPVRVLESELKRGETKPPKPYTEASLLGAMERAGEELDDRELRRAMRDSGLGTPATRAAIIESLLARGYIERRGKPLGATPLGEGLVAALPVEVLTSAQLTGRWESRLAGIASGKDARPAFMGDVRQFVGECVSEIAARPPAEPVRDPRARSDADAEPLAPCPRCEAVVRPFKRGWACDGCELKIWDQVASRRVSPTMAKALLTQGETQVLKGFRSKAGKPFSAALVLEEDGKVGFRFPESPALGDCPVCKTPVRRRGKVYTCERGRACPFVVFAEMHELEIPEEAVSALLEHEVSTYLEGFVSKAGKRYGGVLRWEPEHSRVVVDPRDHREQVGPVGSCRQCQAPVRFRATRWACDHCSWTMPGKVMEREVAPDEVARLLEAGRTPRLHGFRQKGGAYCKAALVLQDDGRLLVDFHKPETPEPPLERPTGGPPPAFGEPLDCPRCLLAGEPRPGYVIAGREAWGCSRWREGCELRIPYRVAGRPLSQEEARRLFGKPRATTYLKGFLDDEGEPRKRTWRVVIDPAAPDGYRLEERRAPKRASP